MKPRRAPRPPDEPLHPQDAAALARLRARLRLTPAERWELWLASMQSLEGWWGIARQHPSAEAASGAGEGSRSRPRGR